MAFTIRGGCSLAVLVATLRVAAAEPNQITLADVVAVAVRQSPELERAKIDVDAARAELTRVTGIEDTILGAQLTASTQRNTQTVPAGELNLVGAELSVARRLSTGGRVSLTAGAVRNDVIGEERAADGSLNRTTGIKQVAATLTVGVNQPLLRGAWSTAFEAPIRQAERQRDAAALTRQARARDLVVGLAQAYWQVAFAHRQLEIRKGSLELATRQLAYTEGAIRAEKLPRSEALAVQGAIAIRKQDVIAGEQEVIERSLALRQLAGLEIGPDALALTTEPLPVKLSGSPIDPDAAVRAAFERSPELAALAAARLAAEAGLQAADGAARSRLDLDVSAGPAGTNRTLSSALSKAVDDTGYLVSASLTFERAIERSSERGGQAAARAVLATARAAEREGQAQLAVRATRAAQRARAALASIALGDEAIGLAEQNVAAEQRRFELGKSTNFEVLQRQDELQQARLRHAAAMADYLAAQAELDGMAGALLARFGIVMQ